MEKRHSNLPRFRRCLLSPSIDEYKNQLHCADSPPDNHLSADQLLAILCLSLLRRQGLVVGASIACLLDPNLSSCLPMSNTRTHCNTIRSPWKSVVQIMHSTLHVTSLWRWINEKGIKFNNFIVESLLSPLEAQDRPSVTDLWTLRLKLVAGQEQTYLHTLL